MGTVPTSKRAPLRRAASPPPTPRSPLPHTFSTFYIFFCVGYYFVVSLSLTFINKNVLNNTIEFMVEMWLETDKNVQVRLCWTSGVPEYP